MTRRITLFALLVSMLAASAALADVSTTLYPVADTWVNSQSPFENYGGSLEASVYSENDTPFSPDPGYVYVRFDLTSIPAEATILEATLTMTAFNGFAWGGDGTVYIHFVPNDAWGEMTVTWATRPEYAGTIIGNWWLWYNGTPIDLLGQTSTAALAAAVQGEVAGDRLLTVMLRSPGYDTRYYTRESGNRPSLTVRYDVPVPTRGTTWGRVKTQFDR